MLSVSIRKKVEYLCERIAVGAEVQLADMMWLSKYEKASTGVREKVRRARRAQRRKAGDLDGSGDAVDSLDEFMDAMDIGDVDPSNHVNGFSGADEVVEWFKRDKADDWRQRD